MAKRAADRTAVARVGRPSTFTDVLGIDICARLAEGQSMRTICAADDMPDRRTVERWAAADPDFAASIARAREAQADTLAAEVVEIADDATATPDGIEHAKLRIAARQWYAGKVRPKVYGDVQKGPAALVQINNAAAALAPRLTPPADA